MIDKALGFDAPVGRRKRPDTNSEAFVFINLDLQVRKLQGTLLHLPPFSQQSKNYTKRSQWKLKKTSLWIKKLLLLATFPSPRGEDSQSLKKVQRAKNKFLLLLLKILRSRECLSTKKVWKVAQNCICKSQQSTCNQALILSQNKATMTLLTKLRF